MATWYLMGRPHTPGAMPNAQAFPPARRYALAFPHARPYALAFPHARRYALDFPHARRYAQCRGFPPSMLPISPENHCDTQGLFCTPACYTD